MVKGIKKLRKNMSSERKSHGLSATETIVNSNSVPSDCSTSVKRHEIMENLGKLKDFNDVDREVYD